MSFHLGVLREWRFGSGKVEGWGQVMERIRSIYKPSLGLPRYCSEVRHFSVAIFPDKNRIPLVLLINLVYVICCRDGLLADRILWADATLLVRSQVQVVANL